MTFLPEQLHQYMHWFCVSTNAIAIYFNCDSIDSLNKQRSIVHANCLNRYEYVINSSENQWNFSVASCTVVNSRFCIYFEFISIEIELAKENTEIVKFVGSGAFSFSARIVDEA